MYRYAQIDSTGFCVSVSNLSGEIETENMLPLDPEDDVQPGDIWDGETWTRPDPPVPPEPGPSALDIIGEQLVQRELETLELKSENQLLGQQIVALELRTLALEGGAGA